MVDGQAGLCMGRCMGPCIGWCMDGGDVMMCWVFFRYLDGGGGGLMRRRGP